MSTFHVDIDSDEVKHVTELVQEKYPDSVMCFAPINPKSTFAPTKGKKYFRISCDILIPPEAIEGGNCLDDFGAMVLLRLPKNRIKPNFLRENQNKQGDTP